MSLSTVSFSDLTENSSMCSLYGSAALAAATALATTNYQEASSIWMKTLTTPHSVF